ncbi:hypothetical protein [Streptomyces sp. NPDC056358]|uniref:hypothetical protein n=1 Tax=Streptomyces sp. NPDC056358 TaxID=3345794 RepID=UPI0035E2AC55
MWLVSAWLEGWGARLKNFLAPDEELVYVSCVQIALSAPDVNRLLGKRTGVTRQAVMDRMRTTAYVDFVKSQCDGTAKAAFDKGWADLRETQRKHHRAADESAWDWRLICLLIATLGITAEVLGGPLALVSTAVVAAATVFALFWRGTAVWFNLRHCLIAASWGGVWLVQRTMLGVAAAKWGECQAERGTSTVVAQLVQHMLGEDPDSLFIPENFEGLRAPRAPGYVVDNEAAQQLKRKLAHIQYGTIAVCGPRGAGKTTLLEQCVKQADFGLIIQAPATYTPHDFLLTMSVRLCETYMRVAGYTVPEFTRLSPLGRLLGRIRTQALRLGRWSAFALPAAALVVLGASAPVRALYGQYASTLADIARTRYDMTRDLGMEIWHGHTVVASVTVILAGIGWWQSRHTAWLPRLAGPLWRLGSACGALALVVTSVGTSLYDEQLNEQVRHLDPNVLSPLILPLLLFWVCRTARDADVTLGRSMLSLEAIFRPATAACLALILLRLIQTPQTYDMLADPENPLRLAMIVAGILLAKAGGWRPRPSEPELVTLCRNHLYRLQTIQSSTNGLTTGGTLQALNLGSSHSTSISTIPPNFPEVVENFRDLLRRIATQKAVKGETVVIAIDEVDRLGSVTQALAFLSEIKAILGVQNVYYLISVAEDVGAKFVRRGLPHRDVTDSSLDDIIHVQPSTLKESRTILAKRCESLPQPYTALAHALSGGILRDLLRYGVQITEMQEKAQSYELTEISRHLILEELSETFAGFRTLLSNQQWSRNNSTVLGAFRTLSGYLRDSCPCTEAALWRALEEFAFYGASDRPGPDLTDDARHLVDEASVYAYFSLTLLDIFSISGLENRTEQAAEHGLDGDLERLAEARQELGISPHSARPLIDAIRKAWSLPLGPSTNSRIPQQRTSYCNTHMPSPLHPSRGIFRP